VSQELKNEITTAITNFLTSQKETSAHQSQDNSSPNYYLTSSLTSSDFKNQSNSSQAINEIPESTSIERALISAMSTLPDSTLITTVGTTAAPTSNEACPPATPVKFKVNEGDDCPPLVTMTFTEVDIKDDPFTKAATTAEAGNNPDPTSTKAGTTESEKEKQTASALEEIGSTAKIELGTTVVANNQGSESAQGSTAGAGNNQGSESDSASAQQPTEPGSTSLLEEATVPETTAKEGSASPVIGSTVKIEPETTVVAGNNQGSESAQGSTAGAGNNQGSESAQGSTAGAGNNQGSESAQGSTAGAGNNQGSSSASASASASAQQPTSVIGSTAKIEPETTVVAENKQVSSSASAQPSSSTEEAKKTSTASAQPPTTKEVPPTTKEAPPTTTKAAPPPPSTTPTPPPPSPPEQPTTKEKTTTKEVPPTTKEAPPTTKEAPPTTTKAAPPPPSTTPTPPPPSPPSPEQPTTKEAPPTTKEATPSPSTFVTSSAYATSLLTAYVTSSLNFVTNLMWSTPPQTTATPELDQKTTKAQNLSASQNATYAETSAEFKINFSNFMQMTTSLAEKVKAGTSEVNFPTTPREVADLVTNAYNESITNESQHLNSSQVLNHMTTTLAQRAQTNQNTLQSQFPEPTPPPPPKDPEKVSEPATTQEKQQALSAIFSTPAQLPQQNIPQPTPLPIESQNGLGPGPISGIAIASAAAIAFLAWYIPGVLRRRRQNNEGFRGNNAVPDDANFVATELMPMQTKTDALLGYPASAPAPETASTLSAGQEAAV
jgi:hypothetical protein